MKYDFDSIVDRRNTNSIKWDYVDKLFNIQGLLPLWVADMDFKSPLPVIESIAKIAQFGIFGYYGIPLSYYDAVQSWMRRRHNWEIEKDWIVPSPGVIPAIHISINTFTQPRDEIILQTVVGF